MAIYELEEDKIKKVDVSTFSALGLKERQDLQSLLRTQIDVIADDVLVISEEFNEWEGSSRSIDLLAVDRSANLVVIELKRTEDGGHMELQSVRYAAMVSNLTFKRAVQVFSKYLDEIDSDIEPEKTLLSFFDWDEINEDEFGTQVRIILASADFSKEVTSTVLWLNNQGLDITCVRLKPYKDNDRVLLDVQTIIPLPETQQYQIKVKEKQLQEKISRSNNTRDFTKFIVSFNGQNTEPLPKRRAMYVFVNYLIKQGCDPQEIAEPVNRGFDRFFAKVDGNVNSAQFIEAIMEGRPTSGKPYYSRFFVKDEELFEFNGDTYAVSNQWGDTFLPAIEALNDRFSSVGITVESEG